MAKQKHKPHKPKVDPSIQLSAKKRQPAIAKEYATPEYPSWSFASLDFDSQWGWSNLTAEDVPSVLARFQEYERKKWKQIATMHNCGPIPAHAICHDAKKRLRELQLDEFEELWKLKVHGKIRVWGMRVASNYLIVWWDPDHTVYPMDPKDNKN